MQIFALDKNGKRLSVFFADRKKNYICHDCQGILRLRGGKRRQLHFYHINPSFSCSQSGKSSEHLATQLHIQKILSSDAAILEYKFPSIGRIADVAWISRKIVFEIQCSSISVEEVEKRNIDYASIGFHVIWILHDRTFNRLRLSSAEEFLISSPHYFSNLNAQGKGMIYDQLAFIRNGRRLQRTFPLPIDVHLPRILSIQKQFPRQLQPFLKERYSWPYFFKGDALDRAFSLQLPDSFFNFKSQNIFHFIKGECFGLFRTLLNALLKKTTF